MVRWTRDNRRGVSYAQMHRKTGSVPRPKKTTMHDQKGRLCRGGYFLIHVDTQTCFVSIVNFKRSSRFVNSGKLTFYTFLCKRCSHEYMNVGQSRHFLTKS